MLHALERLLSNGANRSYGGVSMRTAFAVAVLLIACLLVGGSFGQSNDRFKSVGGEYGQSWINSFRAQTPQATKESNNGTNLWSWGSAPKGSRIVDGKLVADPYYIWRSLNFTNGWLGETYVDPDTGYPVYAYVDPNTGITRYFYVDPNTGKPVYTNVDPETALLNYGSDSPYYSPDYWTGSNSSPSVFGSNSPWS
jgi:hypothetical protein